MSSKTTEISLFEKLDENQIVNADKAVKQAMVYQTKQGKREITYVGIKHIVLEMSAKGFAPIEVIKSDVNLEKDDPDDKSTWHWRAYVKCMNKKTGHESDGRAECPYIGNEKPYQGTYDPFAQRKAGSKAERNALRKQIPELQIIEFLKSCDRDKVQDVDDGVRPRNESPLCTCTPEERNPSDFIIDSGEFKGNLSCKHCAKPISKLVSESIIQKRSS